MNEVLKYHAPYLETDPLGRGLVGLDIISGKLISTRSTEASELLGQDFGRAQRELLNQALPESLGLEKSLATCNQETVAICGVPFSENRAGLEPASCYEIIVRQISACPITIDNERLASFGITKLGTLALPQIDPVSAQVVLGTLAFLLSSFETRTLYIGGKHAMTYPILRAMRMLFNNIGLVWIDAHTDMYHYEQMSSHDARRFSDANVLARILEANPSIADKTVLVGTRVISEEWSRFLRREQVFTLYDIEREGITSVAAKILERLRKSRIYVSVDVDVVDPAFAPSVNTPVAGGLTSREILRLINLLCKSERVFSADIVEMTLGKESTNQTSLLGARMAVELLVGLRRFSE